MSEAKPTNSVLRSLSDASWRALRPSLTAVSLPVGKTIYTAGDPVDFAYFPTGALISQVNRTPTGVGVEAAMVGIDNAAGVLESLGTGRSVFESMVQVDGPAFRVPARAIRRLAEVDPDFNFACWRLAEVQAFESQQTVACQALHAGEHRLARWLLEAHDRAAGRNPLPVTQDIVATMIGVQRTTVSTLEATLQRRGLISVVRGRVKLNDRASLEAIACPCRTIVQQRRAEAARWPFES